MTVINNVYHNYKWKFAENKLLSDVASFTESFHNAYTYPNILHPINYILKILSLKPTKTVP